MNKIVLIAALALSLTACFPNYSDGYRTGKIQNFSYKGTFFKSWEGLIDQGGMKAEKDDFGNTVIVQNAVGFNVPNDQEEVIQKLIKAQENQETVTIHYRQWLIKPSTIDNERVVISVK